MIQKYPGGKQSVEQKSRTTGAQDEAKFSHAVTSAIGGKNSTARTRPVT